jgi:hypothetical protein
VSGGLETDSRAIEEETGVGSVVVPGAAGRVDGLNVAAGEDEVPSKLCFRDEPSPIFRRFASGCSSCGLFPVPSLARSASIAARIALEPGDPARI